MDALLIRRSNRTDTAPSSFRCACGGPITLLESLGNTVVRCTACERERLYELLRYAETQDSAAIECAITARGIVLTDLSVFKAQGF